MAAGNGVVPLLTESNAALIEGGVSMIACSCHPDKAPAMARAVGCRVSPDRQTVTLFFPKPASTDLFDAVRSTGRIAAVFSQPSTHRTVQLKGRASITKSRRDAATITSQYSDSFVAEVCPLGYTEELIRAIVASNPEDLAALTFSVDQAFDQTPGPRAGEALK
jgi:hypothetical protein